MSIRVVGSDALTVTLEKVANIMGTGLLSHFAPNIAQGILVELLKNPTADCPQGVTVKVATEWAKSGRRLLEGVGENHMAVMRKIGSKMGGCEWLTVEWAIDATRHDLPRLASLFMADEEARTWLESQIEEIRNIFAGKA